MDFAGAFAAHVGGGRVLLGRDTRGSSAMLHAATLSSLVGAGCAVFDLGICPTPLLQFAVRPCGAAGALSISGGHNAMGWNSLTFIGAGGEFLDPVGGEAVLDRYHAGAFLLADWAHVGAVQAVDDFAAPYFDALLARLDVAAIRAAKLTVLIDPVGGAGCAFLDEFARRLGVRLLPINAQPSAYLAREPEPRPRSARQMAGIISQLGGDAGFLLSSDLTRLSLVSETGEPASEECTFAVIANHVLGRNAGTVVTNTCTTRMIDDIAAAGSCDFVSDIAVPIPLVVIAELLGVPNEDRHRMFDWSNRMIGSDDPEYQTAGEAAQMASMELYAYASELFSKKRLDPHDDLMSVLTQVDIEGEQLSSFELELFFLLLTVAGNETTRNLISGAMAAFFENPDQWELLRNDRSLLPDAVEEMLRYVTPVMNFRRQSTSEFELGGLKIEADSKVVFFHISANRDEKVFANPQKFDITRNPNPHMAFGGGGPHFCLGANLARMEIRVMFEHLLDRMPDMELTGDVQRLQSAFISGVKHIPISFPAGPTVNAE